jgi:hypothetical protein
MDSISTRYGASLTLPVDTGNITDISADIYIGKPGQVYVLTKNTTLVDGKGVFEFTSDDTKIPLGKYNYQINVTTATGGPDKYPSPEEGCYDCESNFPEFIVAEALDLEEIS